MTGGELVVAQLDVVQEPFGGVPGRFLVGESGPGVGAFAEQVQQGVGECAGDAVAAARGQAADQVGELFLGDAAGQVGGLHQAAHQVLAGPPSAVGQQGGREGGELLLSGRDLFGGDGRVGGQAVRPLLEAFVAEAVQAHQP